MKIEASDEHLEWMVPLPVPRDRVTDAKHFRSTWLTASQAALRDRGHYQAYEALLDRRHKSDILSAVPGIWLPMAIARAHYEACDALSLPVDELLAIGGSATKRAHPTTLGFVARLAQGGGVTPWTVLAQATRLWQSTCDGGAIGVARLGPKEARVDMLGFPLASIRYNRFTMRGIAISVAALFCKKAYAKEVASLTDARSVVLQLSWV
jgi:hypothetical protein